MEEEDAWGWKGAGADGGGHGIEPPVVAGAPESKASSEATGDIAPLQTAAHLIGAKEKDTWSELRHGDGGAAKTRPRRISPRRRCDFVRTDALSATQIDDRVEDAAFVF